MYLHLLSFNFRVSSPELREALYVPESERVSLLREMLDIGEEVFWLTTCNRVECYLVSGRDAEQTRVRLIAWLGEHFRLPRDFDSDKDWEEKCLQLSGSSAVRHLLLVVTSLDSMLVGEPQILGQVKQAYRQALEAESLGALLQPLLQHAFRTAKRVHTETEVAINPLSISHIAVQLARKIFSGLSDKCMLLLGAGEMSQLAAQELKKDGLCNLKVASRTIAHAQALAEQVQAQPACFAELDTLLSTADIVLGSSGATQPLITRTMAAQALKKRKGSPIFFIDIAMPPDIDPTINSLANAYRYDLNDLQHLAEENRQDRGQQIQQALSLVETELNRWLQKQQELLAVPLIRSLRQKITRWGNTECQQTLTALKYKNPLLAQQLEPYLNQTMHRLINRLLHIPSVRLKSIAAEQALLSAPPIPECNNPPLPIITTQARVLAELFDLKENLNPENSLTHARPPKHQNLP